MGNSFVQYLNTLHNGSASNQNAIAEMQITSQEFGRTQVRRPITAVLEQKLERGEIVILTGHAGDGKTTILAQVLDDLGFHGDRLETAATVDCGFPLHYVKDFSELTTPQQKEELEECFRNREAALIIANTGPLLNAFRLLTEDDGLESRLLDAMDQAKGEDLSIGNFGSIYLLNIARLDNTDFIRPYLSNLIASEEWEPCEQCPCRKNCPIFFNVQLIREKTERVTQFIENCYIWLGEHSHRTTIRQITSHLAFSITGGLSCDTIRTVTRKLYRYDYLFSNLFFGYAGHHPAKGADQITGITFVKEAGFDRRQTSVDYDLFHHDDYTKYYSATLGDYLTYIDRNIRRGSPATQLVLRRAYLFFGQQEARQINTLQTEQTFSRWFSDYVRLRNHGGDVPEEMKRSIFRAINILFIGEEMKESNKDTYHIYLTLRRNNEQSSNVQLKVGEIRKEELSLQALPLYEYGENVMYGLFLCTGTNRFQISLPLLNYFEEIKDGIILTDVDPMLSNGIDSLKVQLLSEYGKRSERGGSSSTREISIIYMAEDQWTSTALRIKKDE